VTNRIKKKWKWRSHSKNSLKGNQKWEQLF